MATVSLPASELALLAQTFQSLFISRLATFAGTTLTLYDWLLCFSDEWDTIYQSRWTIPKALFFYVRLITPPGLIFGSFQLSDDRPSLSSTFCQAWLAIVTLTQTSSIMASNGLLTFRLTALYKRKRYLVWFIYVFFFSTYGVTFGLVIAALQAYDKTIYYNDSIHLCSSNSVSSTMPALFYAPSAFETFIFVLTAYRAWQDAKIISGPASAPFLTVLYRDGAISFAVMISVRIWNIWIYTTQPISSYNMGTMLMWGINTVLTTRVYMNLVYLAKKPLLSDMSDTNAPTGMFSGNTGPVKLGPIAKFRNATDQWRTYTTDTIAITRSMPESVMDPTPTLRYQESRSVPTRY